MKKCFSTVLIALLLGSGSAWAQKEIIVGDVNGDGILSVEDVSALVATLVGERPQETLLAIDEDAEPSFPVNDGSTLLSIADRQKSLAQLLKDFDTTRALDRSMFSLTEQQYADIKKQADEVCAGSSTAIQKITALNKWVHSYVKYDTSANDPWSVFVNKKGVCQGYANLLKVMLLTQDFPTINVNGWYDGYAHAWTYTYDGKYWRVCDPTNSETIYSMTSYSSYKHLQPDMVDVVLFDDGDCAYNFYEGHFNVCKVTKAMKNFVVPFSSHGYRVTSFNPSSPLPSNVKGVYIGSNIQTLGQNIVGLYAYPAADERCVVDPANADLGSYEGVVYYKNYVGELSGICYIPTLLTTLTCLPMEKVEKNTVYNLSTVEIIRFPKGTKCLESYAIENCPKLRKVYVPVGCTLEPDAIYLCPKDVEVIYE